MSGKKIFFFFDSMTSDGRMPEDVGSQKLNFQSVFEI